MLSRVGSLMLVAALALAIAPAGASAAWAPESASFGVGEMHNVAVTMSDGTVIETNVYYPTLASGAAAPGPFPVIVTQTPYGKDAEQNEGSAGAGLSSESDYLIQRGYIQVLADVRGTGDSQGTWGLFDPVEGTDGATLVRWAAALPHSDGNVGTLGESYLGIDQFATAADLGQGSPLKAMFPIISANDIYRDTAFAGGMPDFEFSSFYLGLTGSLNTLNPLLENQSGDPAYLAEVQAEHTAGLLTYHGDTLANVESGGDQDFDQQYWMARNPRQTIARIVSEHIPAFLVGGWYDLFQRGEPLNLTDFQNAWDGRPIGGPMTSKQPVTGRYQLLMGPWYHVTAGNGVNLSETELAWFDRWLKNEDTGIDRTNTPLHLDQLGTSSYLDANRWPPSPDRSAPYYLGAGGTLGPSAPTATTAADTLFWDGAGSSCDRSSDQWDAGLTELAFESIGQSDPCASNDATAQAGPGVQTYTTAPLKQPMVIAGPTDVTLYATATSSDTEWVATLDDVSPSGNSTPITSGALLGSFRAVDPSLSWTAPDGNPLLPYHPYTQASKTPVVPGQLTRYDIEVFPTFAKIATGDSLRLTISTSDVPHIAPIPSDTANLLGGSYSLQRHAGAASFVELPLAPDVSFAASTLAGLPHAASVPSASPSPSPQSSSGTRACTSRRDFEIRLGPANAILEHAVVRVDGRRVRVSATRGRRPTAVIDVKGLRRSTVVVTISGRTRSGAFHDKRVYHLCALKPVRGVHRVPRQR